VVIIVEVDEHQHMSRTHVCETSRMFDIGQACGGVPVFFLRFNPDKYVCAKKQVDLQDRLEVLVNEMQSIRDNWVPEITMIHLYRWHGASTCIMTTMIGASHVEYRRIKSQTIQS
jgi:hypothetical protein